MSHYSEAKRIFTEEIEALNSVCQGIETSFDEAVETCLSCKGKLVVTGIGKSGIIAHKIAATMASTGAPAVFLNAGEALHGDMGVVTADDVVIMLSNSAQTPELLRMVPSIRRIGARMVGLFGDCNTNLASEMDVALPISIHREACPLNLAPMTSSTVALVTGDALAAALMQARGFTKEDFAVYHPGGTLGRRLLYRVADVMQPLAKVPVVGPEASLDAAIHALGVGRLGAVMIVNSESILQGVLVEADVRRHYLKRTDPAMPVGEAMTRDPKVVNPDVLLGDALELMEAKDRKVYILPVVNGDRCLVGLLRMHDIVAV